MLQGSHFRDHYGLSFGGEFLGFEIISGGPASDTTITLMRKACIQQADLRLGPAGIGVGHERDQGVVPRGDPGRGRPPHKAPEPQPKAYGAEGFFAAAKSSDGL